MATRHNWTPDMCFYCKLLDMRPNRITGRVEYWCARRQGQIRAAYIWRRHCRSFVPECSPAPTLCRN